MSGEGRPAVSEEGPRFWRNDCEAVAGIVVALCIIGAINVFSSSFVVAETNLGNPYFFLYKHGLNFVVGLLFLGIGARINYHRWRTFMPLIFFGVVATLILVLFVGTTVNGAQRWLPLAGVQVQPAEFAKVVAVLIEAAYIAAHVNVGSPSRFFTTQLFLLAVMVVLIEREPDGATALIVMGVPFVMLLASNMEAKNKLCMVGMGVAFLAVVCVVQPYRLLRLLSMLDPWSDPQGAGYQVVQSIQAIGSGGLTGMGPGVGISKYHYLPEAHTDFAFAVFCQEAGFIGAVLVFSLFAGLAYYGIRIAQKAPDALGQNLAFGLTILIVGQAVGNMFMVAGVGPVIGVPLPFISYGGSSLTASLWAIGILLNIGWKSLPPKVVVPAASLPTGDVLPRPHIRRIK